MNGLSRIVRFWVGFSPLLLQVAGCANQAEGERCDRRNGNIDCEAPLVCLAVSGRGQLCCPPAGQVPTVPECTAELVVPDAATPEDASQPDASSADSSESDGLASDASESEAEEASLEGGPEASFEAATTDSAALDGAAE